MSRAREHNLAKVSERYLVHGDSRPATDKLTTYADILASLEGPRIALIAADVQIDLAVADSDNCTDHLQAAGDILANTLDNAVMLEEAGYENELKKHSVSYVQTCLKAAEVPHWMQALTASSVRMDYDTMLDAADRAIRYIDRQSDWGSLVEYVPLLLIARREHAVGTPSMLGRLALSREDTRRFGRDDGNYSWDCGVSFGATGSAYVNPERHLQIKRGHRGRTGVYAEAGATLIRASDHGFSDVALVIDSCLAEKDGIPNNNDGLLDGEALDAVTDSLYARMRVGSSYAEADIRR